MGMGGVVWGASLDKIRQGRWTESEDRTEGLRERFLLHREGKGGNDDGFSVGNIRKAAPGESKGRGGTEMS